MDTNNHPKKNQVLSAAELLYAKQGENFTMEQLSEKSGVPRAVVYRIFSKKSDILRAISEKNKTPPQTESPEVSQRILEAAKKIISTSGFHEATIEKIAEAAGVGPATVYRRFGDKNNLMRAIAEASPTRQLLREMSLQVGPNFEETLLQITERFIEIVPQLAPGMVMSLSKLKTEHPSLFASIQESQDRSHNILSRWFGELMDAGYLRKAPPEECATAYMGILFGFCWLGPSLRLSSSPPDARLIVSIFLQGLINKGANHEPK